MFMMSGLASQFPADLFDRLARYRHKVFIERLGWPLPAHNGRELDQFDRPDTIYLAAIASDGTIRGCARLLPSTGPTLMGEVFPHLLDGRPVPSAPEIWEVSRFAADSPAVTRQMLAAALACAREHGAARLIAISPLGMERLLRRMGVAVRRAGAPVTLENREVFACWIEVQAPGFKALNRKAPYLRYRGSSNVASA